MGKLICVSGGAENKPTAATEPIGSSEISALAVCSCPALSVSEAPKSSGYRGSPKDWKSAVPHLLPVPYPDSPNFGAESTT